MSRLETGQLALRRSVFALRPVLTGALEMMRPLAAQRGITLALTLERGDAALLFNDPIRLRQVLLNLLSNAAKYAAPGEVLLLAESPNFESVGFESPSFERPNFESPSFESIGFDMPGPDGETDAGHAPPGGA